MNVSNLTLLIAFAVMFAVFGFPNYAESNEDLIDLDFEELMNVEVTSVSRYAESMLDAAAAIYVVSQKDISRSGATSIPEALRMVPGLYVAQIDSSSWVVGARSFPGRFANKLLVLVDGRTVYTPAFSGVYWENLDVVMKDIDRIEVIRGPGATLWGANAVNGVINIITKSTRDTKGGYTLLRAGTEENSGTFRYGKQFSERIYSRAYLKFNDREEQVLSTGESSVDGQELATGGFRFDIGLPEGDSLTLQGDVFDNHYQQQDAVISLNPPYLETNDYEASSEGWNVLSRWEKPLSTTSDISLQAYINNYSSDEEMLPPHEITTFDLDFQHHRSFVSGHDLIWGLGYRRHEIESASTEAMTLVNSNQPIERYSAFLQDEISLVEDELFLTIGSKFEDNTFTDFEYQPSLRLLWKAAAYRSFWAAWSRSVRTPSIIERAAKFPMGLIPPSTTVPVPTLVYLDATKSEFESEEHISFEIGYREQLSNSLSFDSSLFYSKYDNFRSIKPGSSVFMGTYALVEMDIQNEAELSVYGIEMTTRWHIRDDWQLSVDYSYSEVEVDNRDPEDILTARLESTTPNHQLSIRSLYDLSSQVDFDIWLRYTDSVNIENLNLYADTEIPSYWALDLRVTWQPNESVRYSVVAQGLQDDETLENVDSLFNTQEVSIEHSIYAQMELEF